MLSWIASKSARLKPIHPIKSKRFDARKLLGSVRVVSSSQRIKIRVRETCHGVIKIRK